ncbi:MAG: TatD family hydrolase, partial [bacterium]|nr:TatD family hydrolase [bacterium]
EVIQNAHNAGVNFMVIPGTDIHSSQKAVEIAEQYEGIYAAVGIHPHHVFQLLGKDSLIKFSSQNFIDSSFITLLQHKKVVAIGEIGLDKHEYKDTKYQEYQINPEFISLQEQLLKEQIKIALEYNKSLILHNWEAKTEMLKLLSEIWDSQLEGKTVFHCCEPDKDLLEFAKQHKIYIGVDGDITYSKAKQEFVKQVPLEMLVLETDSPYLLPEPLRTQKKYPNEPKNIPVIADYISKILKVNYKEIKEVTTENAKNLFQIKN